MKKEEFKGNKINHPNFVEDQENREEINNITGRIEE
jgi:hypothetical protein